MKSIWVVTTADGKRETFDYYEDAEAYAESTKKDYEIEADWI
jgi:hypothetical protein